MFSHTTTGLCWLKRITLEIWFTPSTAGSRKATQAIRHFLQVLLSISGCHLAFDLSSKHIDTQLTPRLWILSQMPIVFFFSLTHHLQYSLFKRQELLSKLGAWERVEGSGIRRKESTEKWIAQWNQFKKIKSKTQIIPKNQFDRTWRADVAFW